jgi:proprotein convertase subtilisin/kexin type 2
MGMKLIYFTLILCLGFSSCTQTKDTSTDDLVKWILLSALLNPPCKFGNTVKGGSDPLFPNQWHLNQGNDNDAGVEVPWNQGILGNGITVAVVDDGMETGHEDLCGNLSTVKSYNYLKNSRDPNHYYLESGHGTSVAGVIGAKINNNRGLRGAAPSSTLTARNILELNFLSDSVLSDAMTKDISGIHISNNSWGAPDKTGFYSDVFASSAWRSAIESGISTGRGGLGTVYTWAAGNGAYDRSNPSIPIDNSNFDGQANFHGVLAICGVGKDGKKAFYSEAGANLWVCAHTMGNDLVGIRTTDRSGDRGGNYSGKTGDFSNRSYRNDFNGTSSSAPLAAGVIALLLSKYPNLSWRDVREILAESAVQNDPSDTSEWTTNGAGLHINHKYGFGTIHAQKALERAATWVPISNSKPYISEEFNTISNTSMTIINSNINYIEYIDIYFTSDEPDLGAITLALLHSNQPSTTSSILTEPHSCYTSSGAPRSCENFSGSNGTLRFGSARHLGESVNTGSWSVQVTNGSSNPYSAKLIFRGRTSK